MASKSGIYQLLEDRLKATGTEPLTITEDDASVTLDFEQLTITIHRKN